MLVILHGDASARVTVYMYPGEWTTIVSSLCPVRNSLRFATRHDQFGRFDAGLDGRRRRTSIREYHSNIFYNTHNIYIYIYTLRRIGRSRVAFVPSRGTHFVGNTKPFLKHNTAINNRNECCGVRLRVAYHPNDKCAQRDIIRIVFNYSRKRLSDVIWPRERRIFRKYPRVAWVYEKPRSSSLWWCEHAIRSENNRYNVLDVVLRKESYRFDFCPAHSP